MTKKEKDAIIAKGEADKAALEAEEAKKTAKKSKGKESEEDEDSEPIEEEDDSESEDGEEDDESDDSSDEDVDIDYEEIATAETERANKAEEELEKARKKLAGESFKKRKDKKDEEDGEDEDDDDSKPIRRKDLNSVISKVLQESTQNTRAAEALRYARQHTKSEKEAQAALVFLRTRVLATNDVEEDVQSAISIMNRKKNQAEKSELIRSNKAGKSKDFAGTHRQGDQGGNAKMTSRDSQALKDAGMSWDTVKRVYKKAIGDGKTFFYYDPKSKKRWKGK